MFHHVSNEIDAQVLWKKLGKRFEQKSMTKPFLIQKPVNLKFKDLSLVADHMNKF